MKKINLFVISCIAMLSSCKVNKISTTTVKIQRDTTIKIQTSDLRPVKVIILVEPEKKTENISNVRRPNLSVGPIIIDYTFFPRTSGNLKNPSGHSGGGFNMLFVGNDTAKKKSIKFFCSMNGFRFGSDMYGYWNDTYDQENTYWTVGFGKIIKNNFMAAVGIGLFDKQSYYYDATYVSIAVLLKSKNFRALLIRGGGEIFYNGYLNFPILSKIGIGLNFGSNTALGPRFEYRPDKNFTLQITGGYNLNKSATCFGIGFSLGVY